jgi:hypothetical protein
MTRTNEPSTYNAPDWPLNAVPRHWVESLFAKMAAFYGDRFGALWRGSNIEDVQKAWGIELFKLTTAQMKSGADSLTALVKAPTLPEFIAHCKQARIEAVASSAPQLENLPKVSPEVAAENVRRVRAAAGSLRPQPSAEWAFKAVLRGKSVSGGVVPFSAMRCATDAITSLAGWMVVDDCPNPSLKAQYAELRQKTIDDYRMRGIRLWNV